jgi:hypothetical protein
MHQFAAYFCLLKKNIMDRYLIASPHTAEECAAVVRQVNAAGFITHMDWGCKDHDHTGWTIVEADSHEEAKMMVPSILRHTAHIVRVVKYSPADFNE